MHRNTKRERILALRDEYVAAGHDFPIRIPDLVKWALQEGKWSESESDVERRLAREIGVAMSQESYIDPQGNSVRVNHAAPSHGLDGQLSWAWDDIRRADRKHMQAAFQNRRMHLVHGGKQLKTDVDSYNRNNNPGEPIQLSLDLTHDVADIEAFERISRHLEEPIEL